MDMPLSIHCEIDKCCSLQSINLIIFYFSFTKYVLSFLIGKLDHNAYKKVLVLLLVFSVI